MSEVREAYTIKNVHPLDLSNPIASNYWEMVLNSLYQQVDALERLLGRNPRTAEMREWYRRNGPRGNT